MNSSFTTIQKTNKYSISSGHILFYDHISSSNRSLFIPSLPTTTILDSQNNRETFIIHSLIDKKYKLKKEISINLEREDGDFIGAIPELAIYAWGNNFYSMLSEINYDITELCDDLYNMPNEALGKKPKLWKKFFLEHIETVNG